MSTGETPPGLWAGPVEEIGEHPVPGDVMPGDATAAERPHINIDEALDRGWFEIWYQPKIDLKRKCLAGAEALARVRHPALGVLLPGTFVPSITEHSIERLTEHALLTTLEAWSKFDDAGFNLHLSINVPVSVILNLPIPQIVAEHRPKSDQWPGIILEVTEDQVVRDIKLVHAIAGELRVAGISIAIDEFGAGYSSLSSLRELPFVELKIDDTFVRDCATDPTAAAICQTAIDLAHRFGSAAVAEGIERQADLHALMAMGCDFGQGVLIAPPMPQERFIELLLQRINRPRQSTVPEYAADPAVAGSRGVDRVA
jgi:EAL domain-containing protein (putative c-di-GMP-specific phosphodiesterase class I)